MKDSVTTMRAKWNALQLQLLVPAPLTDEDFAILATAREDPLNQAFLEHTPLVVARFREDAQDEIMHCARLFAKTGIVLPYHRAYISDTTAINKILFGTASETSDTLLGFFSTSRARCLHGDGNNGPHPIYLGRIGALPAWYIRHKDEMTASDEVRRLIEEAGEPEGEEARQELERREILIQLPLNDVALILSRTSEKFAGTMHCSSLLPPEGAYSAFFHNEFKKLKKPGCARTLFGNLLRFLPSHP